MYRWLVKFEIIPSLYDPELIGKYDFEVIDKKTYVDVFYETKTNYEHDINQIANEHKLEIQRLMVRRMINLRSAKPIETKILGIKGLDADPLLSVTFSSTSSIYDEDDSIKASCDFWNLGFKNKIKGKENEVFRLADWIILAEKQNDDIKSFILTWIAFNGLYNLFSSVSTIQVINNDAQKIDNVIDGLLEKSDAKKIVDTYPHLFDQLQSFGICSQNGKTNYSQKLKGLRNSTRDLEVIKCAVRCIYGIRKEVFHEAPDMGKATYHNCKVSKDLLSVITMQCLKKLVIF
ncbi:hypothetical protein [Methanosarcina sp.]|uniref:hypothetical protein n=1 Tax=Methanosarcina sp. TaxID=2213 RepID=UPI003C737104